MSDKEKNPDFHLEIDEDDLELTLDDNIFEEKEAPESDDLLTEEELENLIIGIDEENDILDIPDEEEVLEELKFFDENFSLPEKVEEKPEKVAKVEEKPKKPQKEKPKKEKKPKVPREPFDYQYFLIKNKFKLLAAFIVFIIFIFITTFVLVLNKKPKMEEAENVNSEHTVVAEGEHKEALTEEEIAINSLKEELAEEKDEERKHLLQEAIIELEGKKVEKVREEKLVKLQDELKENLVILSPSLFKVEEDIVVMAFTAEKEEYIEELYEVITKVFEDEYQINKLSVTILSKEEKIKNLGQITVDIAKFKEISEKHITVREKLKLLNFEKRTEE